MRAKREIDAFHVEIGGEMLTVLSLPVHDDPEKLTTAERAIVKRLLRGETNAAIARARGTSTRTVANQVAHVFRKLGVRSRRELAARLRGAS
jgi:DNA-binding NarL/FixJ family response regulator